MNTRPVTLFFVTVVLLIGLLFVQGSYAQQEVQPESQPAVSIGELHHGVLGNGEWWHLDGITLQTKEVQTVLSGNGRVLVTTRRGPFSFRAGAMMVSLVPGAVAFVDQVDNQVRLMLLSGKAMVSDGIRQFGLTPSQQVVISPEPNAGYFIDDGIYRRAVRKQFEDTGRKTLIRQFYLEQVVYTDPILRTLYRQEPKAKRLIERVNKTAAILRDLNGTWNYEQGQV